MRKSAIFFFLLLFTLILSISAQDIKEKVQNIANELGEIQKLGGDHLKYSEQSLLLLNQLFDVSALNYSLPEHSIPEWQRVNEEIDLFSLLSGGLAIRESLQLHKRLRVEPSGKMIPLHKLKAPEIQSHPFGKMLEGREWKANELAKFAPEDFYYFHFSNMKKILDFLDYVNEIGGSMYKSFSPASVDFQVKEKILQQLALRLTPEARNFYDDIIEDLIIVGSDPFIMEGTDITLIYNLKQSFIFEMTMLGYRQHFINTLQATETKIKIGEHKVKYLSTPDKKVNSYLLILPNNTAILSNSLKALETVLLTSQKKRPSLWESLDYRYMRSIYPENVQLEDGFVYLSEAFIRRLIGPELKIKESRRVTEALRLANFERLIILYWQLFGKFPKNKEEIFSQLKSVVPENKKEILTGMETFFSNIDCLENSFSGYSSKYGKIGYFTSNWETKLTEITEGEAKAYKNFAEEYNSYWRTFFDPIGVRIKVSDSTKLETCILPLINNSIYDSVTSILGGEPVSLSRESIPGEIFSTGIKINPYSVINQVDHSLGENIVAWGREISNNPNFNLLNFLGNEIEFHVLDANPLIDFESKVILQEILRGRSHLRLEEAAGLFLVCSIFYPLRVSIATSENLEPILASVDEYLAKLKIDLQSRRDYYYRWDLRMDHYSFFYKDKKIRACKLSYFGLFHFRFFYALHQGKLHLTTTEQHIKKVLDSDSIAAEPILGNIKSVFRPNQMGISRDTYELSIAEKAKESSFSNFGTIKLLSLLFPNEQDLSKKCLENFGFMPISPVGGEYKIQQNMVQDSVLGNSINPILDIEKISKAAGTQQFFNTKEIFLVLRFTPEGIITTIEIK